MTILYDEQPATTAPTMKTKFNQDRLDKLFYFIPQREYIRLTKERGDPKPWTDDDILQNNRFCNVRRMDDKVSQWLLQHWYPAGAGNIKQTMANAAMARLINWPDSLEHFIKAGLNEKYSEAKVEKVMRKIREQGKLFTGVYIINGIAGQDKIVTVRDQFTAMHKQATELLDTDSMQRTHSNLQVIKGNGSFMAGQMVADLRHVAPGNWFDRHTWAPLGPGSRRGIAWLTENWNGIDKLPNLRQSEFEERLRDLHLELGKRKNVAFVMNSRGMEMHDVQNCLCEFDKYMRIHSGTGKARNAYPGRG